MREGGTPGAEGGAKQKRKPKIREVPQAWLERVAKEPGVQLPPGGQFCSRTQVWGRGKAVRDRVGEGAPQYRAKGAHGVGVAYLRGPPRRGCGRSGSGCRHPRLSSSGRSWVPLAACASLTAAAAAAPGPGCGAALGTA